LLTTLSSDRIRPTAGGLFTVGTHLIPAVIIHLFISSLVLLINQFFIIIQSG